MLADFSSVTPWLLALPLLLILAFWLLKPDAYRYEGKPLLTRNELDFYRTLRQAFADYDVEIFPQVAMNAFIKPARGESGKRYSAARGTFAQKHVDFLVCDADTLEILVIIELDDRMHSASRDAARDAITRAAGYTTLRFHSRRKPDAAEIRQLFASSGGKPRTIQAY